MRLYLAGVGGYGKYLLGLDNLRFLVSYYYLKDGQDWETVIALPVIWLIRRNKK